jgi:hypothetical protein
VPGWTSETAPVPIHLYPHSPSIPAEDGEHGTARVYLPVLSFTMSDGAAPAYVWMTDVPSGSVTVQETRVGSAGLPAEVNVLEISAISF